MIGQPPARIGNHVEIRFESGGEQFAVTFDVPPDVDTAGSADATATAGWFLAMHRREALTITAPISPRLHAGMERVAEILLTWDRMLYPDGRGYGPSRLEVPSSTPHDAGWSDGRTADRVDGGAMGGRRVACFFTAGVDSLHSVLRRRDEIDELVFVHGFDLPADPADPLTAMVSARVRDAAALIGLPLIELQCNLATLSGGFGIHWEDYHGAAMATVAHLLAPRYSTVLVPATTTYDCLYPLGSHPLLDPLWSSDAVAIVHDGADATRLDKISAIADHPAAQRHLRVCCENRDDAYNCGVCEKCLRTSVGIRIAGCADRFETLPAPTLRQVAGVELKGAGNTWECYLNELQRRGDDRRLVLALRVARARRALRERREHRPISRMVQ